MNWLAAKLLSLTSTTRLAAVRQPRPERQALDVVERDAERVEVEQERLPRRTARCRTPRDAVDAVDVGRAGERDRVELDRVARPGAPTENERSIAIRNSSLSGSSSTRPLTENAVGGHRRLRHGVGLVDPLAVEPAGAQVVAHEPRRAAVGDGRGRAVLEERVLGAGEHVAAVRRHAGALERRGSAGRRSSGRPSAGTAAAPAGRRGTTRSASSAARTGRSRS